MLHWATNVDPSLLKEPAEQALFDHLRSVKQAFHTNLIDSRELKGRQWHAGYIQLATLHPFVDALFEQVKIIDDDAQICNNRLALLQEVWDLCEELTDFSKIQEHAL